MRRYSSSHCAFGCEKERFPITQLKNHTRTFGEAGAGHMKHPHWRINQSISFRMCKTLHIPTRPVA